MRRQRTAARKPSPASTYSAPGSALPAVFTPVVAGYARGPFVEPRIVTPTDWRWRNTRTYIVQDIDGTEYRCLRVTSGGRFIGYWAVELLGALLPPAEL